MNSKILSKSVFTQDGYQPSNKLNTTNPPTAGSAIPAKPATPTHCGNGISPKQSLLSVTKKANTQKK